MIEGRYRGKIKRKIIEEYLEGMGNIYKSIVQNKI